MCLSSSSFKQASEEVEFAAEPEKHKLDSLTNADKKLKSSKPKRKEKMLPPPDFVQRPISLSNNPKSDSIKKVVG